MNLTIDGFNSFHAAYQAVKVNWNFNFLVIHGSFVRSDARHKNDELWYHERTSRCDKRIILQLRRVRREASFGSSMECLCQSCQFHNRANLFRALDEAPLTRKLLSRLEDIKWAIMSHQVWKLLVEAPAVIWNILCLKLSSSKEVVAQKWSFMWNLIMWALNESWFNPPNNWKWNWENIDWRGRKSANYSNAKLIQFGDKSTLPWL